MPTQIKVLYRIVSGTLECRYEYGGEQYGFEPYIGEDTFETVKDRVELQLRKYLPEDCVLTFSPRTNENGKVFLAREADTEMEKTIEGGYGFASLSEINRLCDILVRTSGFKEAKASALIRETANT